MIIIIAVANVIIRIMITATDHDNKDSKYYNDDCTLHNGKKEIK